MVLAAALLLLPGLSRRDLWEPDEPRLGMVAEELRSMRHGAEGLVLLHLAGEPYTQKPPLYYWLAALAGTPRGRVDELAARLPSALSGVALVAIVVASGGALLGATPAALGAALLLSTFSFAELARRAQLDVLLALLEWLALMGFWRFDRGLGRRRTALALAHGAMGLAVLTKGPVGFLVPVLGFVAFLGWERRLRDLRGFFPPWALLLSLGPGLAWISAAVALAPAGFLGEAVGSNVFGRFFEGTSHARPIYYYLLQLPVEFLPWTLLWPILWWAGRRRVFVESGDPERRRTWRLLLAWVAAAFLFFSLSSGKRGLYLLPTFPALALLCADALVERLRGAASLPRWIPAVFLGLGALLFAAALALVLRPELVDDLRFAWSLPLALGLVVGASMAAAWALARSGAGALARFGAVVGGVLGLELVVFTLLYPALEPTKSPRPIGRAAAAATAPGARIGLVGSEAKLGGIAYYSGRDVVPLDDEADIRAFLETGGTTLVVQSRKLNRIEAVTPVEIVAELREGSRSWVVVTPRQATADP